MLQRTFVDKLLSEPAQFGGLSPYEAVWMALGVIVPILLLKKVEGAVQAAWLLPLVVALYAIDTKVWGPENKGPADAALFPTEAELLVQEGGAGVDLDPFEQRELLLRGWQKYLAEKWAGGVLTGSAEQLVRLAEEGEFHFNVARLGLLAEKGDLSRVLSPRGASPGLPVLVLYFFWNVYFAYTVTRLTPLKNH
jgi:hypothetical protein